MSPVLYCLQRLCLWFVRAVFHTCNGQYVTNVMVFPPARLVVPLERSQQCFQRDCTHIIRARLLTVNTQLCQQYQRRCTDAVCDISQWSNKSMHSHDLNVACRFPVVLSPAGASEGYQEALSDPQPLIALTLISQPGLARGQTYYPLISFQISKALQVRTHQQHLAHHVPGLAHTCHTHQ